MIVWYPVGKAGPRAWRRLGTCSWCSQVTAPMGQGDSSSCHPPFRPVVGEPQRVRAHHQTKLYWKPRRLMWGKSHPPRQNKVIRNKDPRQYIGNWNHHMREGAASSSRWRRRQTTIGQKPSCRRPWRKMSLTEKWSGPPSAEDFYHEGNEWRPSPTRCQNVGIRLQFLPLSGQIWDPFKLVESMEKGVGSLPILNMTGESLLLGNRLSHVHGSRKSNDLDDGWDGVAW